MFIKKFEIIYKSLYKNITFLGYIIFVFIEVFRHEPWFDEAQAWLLARDSNPIDLILKYLRYEGSPGLWHLLLMIPAKLGLPFYTINIISALLLIVGVYFFLKYSPFPFYVNILFPFTYFIFFQYAVVARSYALMPLIMFLLAIIYPKRFEKIYSFTILLCLLANTNLHGMIISISLFILYLKDFLFKWKTIERKKKYIISLLAFTVEILFLFFILITPKNISIAEGYGLKFNRVLVAIVSVVDAISSNLLLQIKNGHDGTFLLNCILFAFSIYVLIRSSIYFFRKKTIFEFIIPTLMLMILFAFKYVNLWHQGIIFLLWIFALWISFEKAEGSSRDNPRLEKDKKHVIVLFLLVMMVQFYWSISSFMYDFCNNYSAGAQVADFIKKDDLEYKKIYINSFYAISILPYFDENIFDNYNNKRNPSFWLWSTKNKFNKEFPILATDKPYLYIRSVPISDNTDCINGFEYDIFNDPDYVLIGRFEGNTYWKDRINEIQSFELFMKKKKQKLLRVLGQAH